MHFLSNKCTFYSVAADVLAAVTVTNVLNKEKYYYGEWRMKCYE